MDLAAWLRTVIDLYPERVLAMDRAAALHARSLARRAREAGLAVGFADLTVGCIARRHNLIVVTRNVRDFAPMGTETVDPFAPL